MITWDQWLHWASLKLKKSFSPRRDAEIILGKVINKSRTQLLAFGETYLENNAIIQLKSLVNRRIQGEPIAYLVGSKEFWSLDLKISPGVFIPRPDTECLVEQVLNVLSTFSNLKVLDLGTGVGAIALALASEQTNWDIIGIDRHKIELTLAHQNKVSFNCKNVKFMYGNWFKYLKNKKFDLIVSNPPYINKDDFRWLDDDIHFEPRHALISPYFGLLDLIKICQYSVYHLRPNGWVFLEHGWNQGQYVRSLLSKLEFNKISTTFDYNCCERVTCGQWKPSL